jgi:hypothetical protein
MTSGSDMRARSLDQFFTTGDVAAQCVGLVTDWIGSDAEKWLWLEPSAGGGAFLDQMPFPRIGLDIHSQRPDISAVDFLAWHPGRMSRRIAVVGNPPFGKNASLARRFFDHAASFADMIAFIVPRTFQKPAFANRLDRHMHLLSETLLEEASFEFEGEPYAVPTVFQMWERRQALRPLVETTRAHGDFDFVAQRIGDFAFQRVGARAGLVSVEGLQKSPQSHYFMKANMCSHTLLNRLRSIDWTPIKHRTAGNPSIGKAELVGAYQASFG